MKRFLPILQIAIITSLLTSCLGNTAGLWGEQITPTNVEFPSQTAVRTRVPSLTPSPSITPLKEIPMPGTATPILSPTMPNATNTASPTPENSTPVATFTQPVITATLPAVNASGPMDVYHSQGGDTLNIVAKRFALRPEQIITDVILPPPDQLIPPDTLLLVPKPAPGEIRGPGENTIPDSEVVYGPASVGFSLKDYVTKADGYLVRYEGSLSSDQISGIEAVERICDENSLSPRIILAIIEYESHWVLSHPTNLAEDEYPLGYVEFLHKGLFRQLMWASGALSDGYYRWRSGNLNELKFTDGSTLRLNPFLNAGTAAIQYYFAQNHSRAEWDQAIAPSGFPALYERMFGPTLQRAQTFEPTIPNGLVQPFLSLPFEPGHLWALTGGPHSAWEKQGALAALDFAPSSMANGCMENNAWVVAPAAGKVIRLATGVVMLDLDGDGLEQTGWVILFMHISTTGKVVLNQTLQKDAHIGHPSCEGGVSTGTHLHIARKYNGEWMLADGPLSFNMDGWIAHNGVLPYKGSLTRGEQIVTACTCSTYETNIIRDK
ncbi:MAG: hypothetical protein NTW32_14470 [Chloroflexi bacterium]|nr:hypothetical protein [Chloroflexota bacterium]